MLIFNALNAITAYIQCHVVFFKNLSSFVMRRPERLHLSNECVSFGVVDIKH